MSEPVISAAEASEIKTDRMRFTKNTASSRLCYLAILLDVFYFVNIYESDRGSWYYSLLIGASIVVNLLFMLYVFLASEGVKNYKSGYSIGLYLAGVFQAARVFVIPMQAMQAQITVNGSSSAVMSPAQGAWAIGWLIGSAVCLILAGIINQKKCVALARHAKKTEVV